LRENISNYFLPNFFTFFCHVGTIFIPKPGLHPPVALKTGSLIWQASTGVQTTEAGLHVPPTQVDKSQRLFKSVLQLIGVLIQVPK
jgi:hypothetical protein